VTAMLLAYPNADMTLSAPSVEHEGHGWGLEADDLRMSMTWPPPARASWACCGRSWRPCPCWPILAMKAPAAACMSR
jgi:hypothetical protein